MGVSIQKAVEKASRRINGRPNAAFGVHVIDGVTVNAATTGDSAGMQFPKAAFLIQFSVGTGDTLEIANDEAGDGAVDMATLALGADLSGKFLIASHDSAAGDVTWGVCFMGTKAKTTNVVIP